MVIISIQITLVLFALAVGFYQVGKKLDKIIEILKNK